MRGEVSGEWLVVKSSFGRIDPPRSEAERSSIRVHCCMPHTTHCTPHMTFTTTTTTTTLGMRVAASTTTRDLPEGEGEGTVHGGGRKEERSNLRAADEDMRYRFVAVWGRRSYRSGHTCARIRARYEQDEGGRFRCHHCTRLRMSLQRAIATADQVRDCFSRVNRYHL